MTERDPSFHAPTHDQVGLLARAAAKWAVILSILRQILTIGTTMVVSRYVTPEEFGIAGMVLSFVAFLVLFDTGLTWATVQAPELSKDKVDGLFFFGLGLGLVLWGVAVAAGPYLAVFYAQPELATVSRVMGAAVFLNGLTTQPAAVLKRQLRQKTTNIIDTVALFGSSAVAIVLALNNGGYWAVVGQVVTLQAVRGALLFIYSGYWPSWPVNFSRAHREIKIGAGLALSNYVCYFQLYLGSILVGRFFGVSSLGNYQRAYGVKSMPTAYATMVVTDVMVSSLAALRSDAERMGEAYRKALRLIAFIGCPAGAALYPLAPEVIRILYGSQWLAAVPMLEWFALAAVALPISTTTIWLFLASGKVQMQFVMNIFLSMLAVISLVVAAIYSDTVEGVVAVESILFAGPYLLVNLIVSHRAVGMKLAPTLRIITPILIGSFVGAGCAILVGQYVAGLHWGLLFAIKVSVGAVGYIISCMLLMGRLPFPLRVVGLK